MKRSNAPTLADVAREAGVTPMAASVVLNGSTSSARVSETTRLRIKQAAARLQYRPNAVAQGLLNRRMNTIGVVAIVGGPEINLYFLEVLNGILETAAIHDQSTTIFSITDWNEEEKILQCFDGRVDGMIFIAPHDLTSALMDRLQKHTPVVLVHGSVDLNDVCNIDINNEIGAYEVVKHLISLGHRRIAHLTGGRMLLGAQQREAGYRRALEEHGIQYDETLCPDGFFSINSGRVRTMEILKRLGPDQLPTAVFCGSDAIALGCIEALTSNGISVPGQISVAGFDDSLLARITHPPLTTVRQPFRRMGSHAVNLLLSQIKNEPVQGVDVEVLAQGVTSLQNMPLTELFPTELVIRESTGPAPK